MDYVIDYRLHAAALMRASYFWRPRRLSRLATRRRPEMSVVGPVSSVPLARRLPEEMCARRRPERWLTGWLAGCEAYESVQIGPNDATRRVKAKVRGDQFAERASERANEREVERKSLDTRWNRFRAWDVNADRLRAQSGIKACAHLISFLSLDDNL